MKILQNILKFLSKYEISLQGIYRKRRKSGQITADSICNANIYVLPLQEIKIVGFKTFAFRVKSDKRAHF